MKNKRLHSFSLSNNIGDKLDKICKKKNIKKTNFIEQLIENFKDKEIKSSKTSELDNSEIIEEVIKRIKERL